LELGYNYFFLDILFFVDIKDLASEASVVLFVACHNRIQYNSDKEEIVNNMRI